MAQFKRTTDYKADAGATFSSELQNGRRIFLRNLGCVFAGANTLGGTLMSNNEANAASRIAVPGVAWRRGATVRHHLDKHSISVTALAWRSDSQRLAWRSLNGPGWIFDTVSKQYGPELPAPQNGSTSTGLLWLSGTHRLLLGGGPLGTPHDSPIAFMDVDGDTGQILHMVAGAIDPRQPLDPSAGVANFPLSPIANSAKQLFQDGTSGEIVVKPFAGMRGFEVFDPATWKVSSEHANDLVFSPCDVRPGSAEAAFNGGRGTVLIVDRATGHTRRTLRAHPADTWTVKYSPDGKILLTAMLWIKMGQNDRTVADPAEADRHKIKAWRTGDYSLLGQIEADMGPCQALDFHPDGEIFAVAADREIVFFETASLKVIARSPCQIDPMECLAFSPGGSWLAIGGVSGSVCLMQP